MPRRVQRTMCVLLALAALAAPSPAGAAEGDARARRDALLGRIAALSDELERGQIEVVRAQVHQRQVAAALGRARDRMRKRSVAAYVRGTAAGFDALAVPGPYLDVVAAKESQLVQELRVVAAAAREHQDDVERVRTRQRQAAVALGAARAELDATVAAEDAQRAEEQRRADEARARAVAEQEAARAAARAAAVAAAAPPPELPDGRRTAGARRVPSAVPSPLDPLALVPRHRQATDRQRELMRQWPFGALPAGTGLPAGLVAAGREVRGVASWYGPGFDGRPTASGAIYDQQGWTVASPDLPLGTFLVVQRNERRVLLLVNDRGPYVGGRVLDLSRVAATALGITGVGEVTAQVVAPG